MRLTATFIDNRCFFNGFTPKNDKTPLQYCHSQLIGKIFSLLGLTYRIHYEKNGQSHTCYIYAKRFKKWLKNHEKFLYLFRHKKLTSSVAEKYIRKTCKRQKLNEQQKLEKPTCVSTRYQKPECLDKTNSPYFKAFRQPKKHVPITVKFTNDRFFFNGFNLKNDKAHLYCYTSQLIGKILSWLGLTYRIHYEKNGQSHSCYLDARSFKKWVKSHEEDLPKSFHTAKKINSLVAEQYVQAICDHQHQQALKKRRKEFPKIDLHPLEMSRQAYYDQFDTARLYWQPRSVEKKDDPYLEERKNAKCFIKNLFENKFFSPQETVNNQVFLDRFAELVKGGGDKKIELLAFKPIHLSSLKELKEDIQICLNKDFHFFCSDPEPYCGEERFIFGINAEILKTFRVDPEQRKDILTRAIQTIQAAVAEREKKRYLPFINLAPLRDGNLISLGHPIDHDPFFPEDLVSDEYSTNHDPFSPEDLVSDEYSAEKHEEAFYEKQKLCKFFLKNLFENELSDPQKKEENQAILETFFILTKKKRKKKKQKKDQKRIELTAFTPYHLICSGNREKNVRMGPSYKNFKPFTEETKNNIKACLDNGFHCFYFSPHFEEDRFVFAISFEILKVFKTQPERRQEIFLKAMETIKAAILERE